MKKSEENNKPKENNQVAKEQGKENKKQLQSLQEQLQAQTQKNEEQQKKIEELEKTVKKLEDTIKILNNSNTLMAGEKNELLARCTALEKRMDENTTRKNTEATTHIRMIDDSNARRTHNQMKRTRGIECQYIEAIHIKDAMKTIEIDNETTQRNSTTVIMVGTNDIKQGMHQRIPGRR